MEATYSSESPIFKEKMLTGHSTYHLLRTELEFPGMRDYLEKDFVEFLERKLANINPHETNIRGPIKEILMWPNFKYDPWEILDIDVETSGLVEKMFSETKFKLVMSDGKIYAMADHHIAPSLHQLLEKYLPAKSIPNNESCHITVVNSDKVHAVDSDKVTEFLEKYQEEFTVSCREIKSTVSKDWCPFSRCWVVSLDCFYLRNFISDFNQLFGLGIKPSLHITFAIVSRDTKSFEPEH